jgi:Holliday junction resolvase
MKAHVYECLSALGERHGPRERGKLCQKLLAIALQMSGCTQIIERGVQGVDVDACQANGEKYSIEVKTTVRDSVPLREKDVLGLRQRAQQDGYRPLLGVLRIGVLSCEWYLAKAQSLRAGVVQIDSLRPYRVRSLEQLIQPLFEKAACDHFDGAMKGAQLYLDTVLREHGIIVEE